MTTLTTDITIYEMQSRKQDLSTEKVGTCRKTKGVKTTLPLVHRWQISKTKLASLPNAVSSYEVISETFKNKTAERAGQLEDIPVL
jgi:hypothetical protein